MEATELLDIFYETSKRLSQPNGYKTLMFTQKDRATRRRIVREPEARHVLARVIEESGLTFGLEVPTKEKYAFSTTDPDSANIDLAVNPCENQVNIELKTGQPDLAKIEKDMEKVIVEPVPGTAFYHVLQNSNRQTVPILLAKYSRSHAMAVQRMANCGTRSQKWFLHYIAIRGKQYTLWRLWPDLAQISGSDFNQAGYTDSGPKLSPRSVTLLFCPSRSGSLADPWHGLPTSGSISLKWPRRP